MELLAFPLALLRVATALAAGGILLRPLQRREFFSATGGPLSTMLAVLTGLAAQGGAHFLLAKIGWGGVVGPAVALDLVFLALLWPARTIVRRGWEDARDEYRAFIDATGRWGITVLVGAAAVLFIFAAGPPRDTDVLRYHLALPQQVVTEGAFPLWRNYHYHFPQGYTFAMLSELAAGVPQTVHYVSALIYALLGAGLIWLCRDKVGRGASSFSARCSHSIRGSSRWLRLPTATSSSSPPRPCRSLSSRVKDSFPVVHLIELLPR